MQWIPARISRILALTLAISFITGGFPSPCLAITPKKAGETLAEKQARMKKDFRIYFGLDDPLFTRADQEKRRLQMQSDLKSLLLNDYECGLLDVTNPMAGRGGAGSPTISSLISFTDLGTLVRDRGCPSELAEDGNYYAKVTSDYENQLQKMILSSPGNLQPADLMRMALRATNGNYVMSTLTLHNFLKNVAYTGRKSDNTDEVTNYKNQTLDNLRYNKLAIAQVSSKLVNLRGYPEKSDKIGPWYHMFGVMMVGALTSERQASIMADLEVASRYLIHPYVKSYSAPDTEKSSWDEVAKDVMKTIHPTIFHSEVPDKRSIQVLSAGAEPLDGNTNAKVNLPIDLSVKYLLSGMSKDSSATVKETAFVDGPAKLNLPSTEYSVKAGINNEKTKSWTFVPSKPGKYTFHYKLGEKCGSRDGSISFVVEPAPPKTSNKEEQSGNGNIIGTSVVIGTNTKGIADIKLGPIGRTYTPNPGVEIGPNFCKCGTSTLTWSNIPTSLTAGQTYSPIMQVAKQDIPLLIATWVNSREDTLLPSEKRSAKPTDVKSSDPKRLVADGSFIAGESSSPRELFIRGSCIASGPKGDQTTNFLIKWEFGPNKKAKKPVETPKSSTTPQIDSSKNAASTPTLPPLPQPGERIDGANKIPEAIAPNSSTGSSKTVDLNGIWNCALTSLGGRMTGQYGNQAIPGGVTSNDPVRISIQGNEMTMQAVNNDKPEQILRGTFDGTTARLHAQWSIGSESGESTVTLRYNSASNTFEGEGDVHATPAPGTTVESRGTYRLTR